MKVRHRPRLLSDNGPCYISGELSDYLEDKGMAHTRGRPYHPQTQGKDERFHRTLKAELLQGNTFADLPACQQAFDRWRSVYNLERPHQALGLVTPVTR